jgi:putative ABC transport system permease protein
VVFAGVEIGEIREKHEILRREWKSLSGVSAVSFSSEVPFYERTVVSHMVTPAKGDATLGFKVNMISIDPDFMGLYGMKLLAGRAFDRNAEADAAERGPGRIKVLVNQTAAENLGFGRGVGAIGQVFYQAPDKRNQKAREYSIVGLVEDRYFYGLSSKMKPLVMSIRPEEHFYASIRLTGKDVARTLDGLDSVWEGVAGNYPIQRVFLDFYFNTLFRILQAINFVFAAFAGLALSLALIGLFGLSAYMARRRTREIAIRKVMGASVNQIVRLLIWRFSKPVMWSLCIAVPSAYLASGIYLDFFSERIDFVIPVILSACVLAILFAWTIVAVHAIKVSRVKPACSLRYE